MLRGACVRRRASLATPELVMEIPRLRRHRRHDRDYHWKCVVLCAMDGTGMAGRFRHPSGNWRLPTKLRISPTSHWRRFRRSCQRVKLDSALVRQTRGRRAADAAKHMLAVAQHWGRQTSQSRLRSRRMDQRQEWPRIEKGVRCAGVLDTRAPEVPGIDVQTTIQRTQLDATWRPARLCCRGDAKKAKFQEDQTPRRPPCGDRSRT